MEHEVLRKLRSAMVAAGHDALVAFSQDNVTYTAGFLVPSHASNRFRRTVTILAGEKFSTQIVVNVEENLAKQRSRFSEIRAYNQFTQDPADVLADVLLTSYRATGERSALARHRSVRRRSSASNWAYRRTSDGRIPGPAASRGRGDSRRACGAPRGA